MIDDLLARQGIEHQPPHETGAAWEKSNRRKTRQVSIPQLLGGIDISDGNRVYGLYEILAGYENDLSKPAPDPVFEPLIDEPPAVQEQQRNIQRGLRTGPMRPVDKFYRSD